MADEGESNPFVDRMKKLVEDSTDAKRIEHDRSVAELQELNKQRVKELIEKDNQRLEQIEKSEEILLGDALEAMNSITPEMLTKDGHVSFESEAFCYLEDEKALWRVKQQFNPDLYASTQYHNHYCNTIEMLCEEHAWTNDYRVSGRTSFKIHPSGQKIYYNPDKDTKPSFSRDGSVTIDDLNREFPKGILGQLKNVVISPNGKTFTTHSDNNLNVYSRRTKQNIGKIHIGSKKQEFSYSPDGKWIGLCEFPQTVTIYDAWSLKKHASFSITTRPQSIIFHPILPIAIVSAGPIIHTFNVETNERRKINTSKEIYDIAISPDGRTLAIAAGYSLILYKFETFEESGSFKLKSNILSINFNPFGMHNDEGAGKMFAKVQAYVLEAGLTLESSDMVEFKLGWKRKVDI